MWRCKQIQYCFTKDLYGIPSEREYMRDSEILVFQM